LGVLCVDQYEPSVSLRESEIDVFAAICNLAAAAIEKEGERRRIVLEKEENELLKCRARGNYPEILCRSEVMLALLERVALAAASPLDVLITGESGTGKELIARALHRTGRRAAGKFVALDCGTLPEALVESELFGYRKGAFTGALENRAGLLEAADGGVLFLDEVSNMPLKTQGKLLRSLQEREIRRLGETTTRKIDVQVLAATNRDLREAVDRGRFREDLYFRLYETEIFVPPLRDRKEDIPLLIQRFLAERADLEGGRIKRLSAEALETIMSHPLPGNVRQLASGIRDAYYAAPGDVIERGHLRSDFLNATADENGESRGVGAKAEKIYREILAGKTDFTDRIKIPFLRRQLGSAVVKQILDRALRQSCGRYKTALKLLRVPQREYAGTMLFLKRHRCFLDFRPYRRRDPNV